MLRRRHVLNGRVDAPEDRVAGSERGEHEREHKEGHECRQLVQDRKGEEEGRRLRAGALCDGTQLRVCASDGRWRAQIDPLDTRVLRSAEPERTKRRWQGEARRGVRLEERELQTRDRGGRRIERVGVRVLAALGVAVLDREPPRLVVRAVGRRAYFAPRSAARHPRLDVVLAVRTRAELLRRHVQHAIQQAQALDHVLLDLTQRLEHPIALVRRRHSKELDFRELVDAVESARIRTTSARFRAKRMAQGREADRQRHVPHVARAGGTARIVRVLRDEGRQWDLSRACETQARRVAHVAPRIDKVRLRRRFVTRSESAPLGYIRLDDVRHGHGHKSMLLRHMQRILAQRMLEHRQRADQVRPRWARRREAGRHIDAAVRHSMGER